MATEDSTAPNDFEFAKESFEPSSFNKSEISSLLSTSLPNSSSVLKQQDKQYDNVKKKYFLSLGMNKPPAVTKPRTSSESSYSLSSEAPISKQRTKTEPSPVSTNESITAPNGIAIPKKQVTIPSNNPRIRSISHPVPATTTVAASLPHNLGQDILFEEEYENGVWTQESNETLDTSLDAEHAHTIQFSEEDEEDPSNSNRRFIPPHELLAQTSSSFNVGTARSVAIWEQKRRQMMDNN
mmetsp:Transcript_5833/g.8167  ORF Transcript_5833/g.8167 Transcript_5833/m.8167 type:complete len:239 (-) Transcript_5833:132-848(-)